MPLLCADKPSHVVLQQESERCFPIENIAHERAAIVWMKFVDMAQTPERAAHHFIDEVARAIDLDDPRRETLSQSEMPSLERQKIAELQCALQAAGLDHALARERSAFRVHADIERQIKTKFRRGSDNGLDREGCQVDLSARSLIARSHMRRMMSLPGRMMRQ